MSVRRRRAGAAAGWHPPAPLPQGVPVPRVAAPGATPGARAPRLLRTIHRFGYAFFADGVAEAAPGPGPAACRLVWGERHIPLLSGDNLLGRASDARVVIDLARVSRHHARIVVEGVRAVLEDLGSKNGTFLRGQPLRAAAELADGDEICIGPAVLVFRTSLGNSTTEAGSAA